MQMRLIVLSSAIAVLLAAASYGEPVAMDSLRTPKRELTFYGGPSYHLLSRSEYTRYLQNQLGIVLHEPNYNGGIVGVMYKRSGGSYLDIDFAVYGTKDRGFSVAGFYDFRFTVFSVEVLHHYEIANGLTLYAGGAPAWVSDNRQIAGFSTSDSILAWPLIGGLRARVKNWILADVRYRYLTLIFDIPGEGKKDFNLGGFFFFLGGQFNIPL